LGADFPIQANAAYCLVTREESLASPIVREFRRWLLLEAQKFTPA
jgi:hypothetical protein